MGHSSVAQMPPLDDVCPPAATLQPARGDPGFFCPEIVRENEKARRLVLLADGLIVLRDGTPTPYPEQT